MNSNKMANRIMENTPMGRRKLEWLRSRLMNGMACWRWIVARNRKENLKGGLDPI